MRRTCRRWPLLPPGERVAIGVSGGVDSLALVALAARYNRAIRPRCELYGIHVALDASGGTAGLPPEVAEWCRGLDVPLETVPPRLDPPEREIGDCFACAHVRRRTLFEAADARGCRVVALGHHADDVVETWLMSLMYAGSPAVLPPLRRYFGGAITLVRPLYELKKPEIVRLARLCGFPEVPASCPLERDTRRDRIRAVLAALGRDERKVRRHLFWAAVRQFEREAAGERGSVVEDDS